MGFRESSFTPSSNGTPEITKKTIIKNILVLDTLFLLTDIGYSGLFAIQSSLHADDGVGTISSSVIYAMFALSSLFFSPFIIRLCGFKWTIVISLVPTLLWILANGVGIWATMIPASMLVGLFGAPIWIAHCSYTVQMAKEYARQTKQLEDKITTFFFGIFSTFKMIGYVFGDTISSTVLSSGVSENYTEPSDEVVDKYCGMNDCPWVEINITTFEDPPKSVVWSLVAVYTVFNVTAIFTAVIFLDPLPKHLQQETQPLKTEVCRLLFSVIKLFKTKRIWFLVMMNLYSASYSTFLYADFSRSWVTCALGIWMVGFVFLFSDLIAAVMGITTGLLATYTGRAPLMIFSFIIGIATMTYIALWPINKHDTWVYFVMIGGISLHSYILEPIMMALHGIAYPENVQGSYGCYNFFWCIMATILYGYNYYVCTSIKVYIQFGTIVVGYLGYFLLEMDITRHSNPKVDDDTEVDMTEFESVQRGNDMKQSKYTKY